MERTKGRQRRCDKKERVIKRNVRRKMERKKYGYKKVYEREREK